MSKMALACHSKAVEAGQFMAYWWVSQNKTYRHERGGGYLWAPARDKSGHTPQHWRTMLDVQPGDLIFSYVGQHIRSLAVSGSSARPDIRPPEFSDQSLWKQEGYRIDVSYEDLHPPIDIPPIAGDLARLLPTRHSPLTRRGTGVQGYLFSLPRPAGRFLLDRAGPKDGLVRLVEDREHAVSGRFDELAAIVLDRRLDHIVEN